MKKSILLLIACFCLVSVQAAYLKDVPMTLTQPDGTVLHCFASGDEFFNYLHDENGFTIMQHPQTGFYVYADKRDGQLVATEFVAGRVDPASKNLKPFNLISPVEWMARRKAWKEKETISLERDGQPNHGSLNNISIFIRFSDDEEFTNTYSSIDNMFNDESVNAVSMKTYFRAASYYALEISTYFYPGHNDETIISYQDIYPRSYFQPYNATTNPNGYQESEVAAREFGLLERAVAYINANYPVPSDLNIDYDNNGFIDNVCFIVRGDVGAWGSLLWPHKWSLYDRIVKINGKRVYTFNFQLADATNYFNTSTMCHEMNHSLGAPDLYHYSYTGPDAVGIWDLMHINTTPPQHCGAYMKMKYGHWIDEIPEITQAGIYTLNPISSPTPTNIAYKIQSDDPNQFYVLEYRDKTSMFETGLPGSGLLIYRIDTRFEGNADYNPSENIYDEVYIFRPEGSVTENGNLNAAYFNANAGRTEFSSSTSAYPFFTDGTPDYNFRIFDITAAGSTISFKYGTSPLCDPPTNLIATLEGNDVTLSWDAVNDAQSYNIYRNGSLINNISGTTYSDNDLPAGTYNYYLKSVDANGFMSTASETVTVTVLPENSIIIGDGGTATCDFLPSYSYYKYALTQQIYTSDEIGEAGYLTGIAFYNDGAEKTRTCDFYLKSTTKNTFSNTIDWETVTDADKVFSGTVTMASGTWTMIDFITPFVYDGASNLVLVVDDNTGDWSQSPHISCRVFDASSQSMYVYSDGVNYNPMAPPTVYGNTEHAAVHSQKNQIVFFKVKAAMQVYADNYPILNNYESPYVRVHWGAEINNIEDFEKGDFSMFSWQLDPIYPWSITNKDPYEGVYCMKSGNEEANNSTSSIECIVQVPNEGKISFFGRISSEKNYDYGRFYIDGVQMGIYTGDSGWDEMTFAVTPGIHTYKWTYSKDSSLSDGDDCFYVDYIHFYYSDVFVHDFEDSKLPAGWTTIDADGDGYGWSLGSTVLGTGYGHNGSDDMFLSQSYINSYGALYPDNYLISEKVHITEGSHFSFWACAQDANWPAEHFGVFVSLGTNTYPDNFQEVQSWTMTAKGGGGRVIEGKASRDSGTRTQGTWYYFDVDLSDFVGTGYIAIRHYNCSDMYILNIDDVVFRSGRSNGSTYNVYRAKCDGTDTQLLAENVSETQYIDWSWWQIENDNYKYGVSIADSANTEILWSNCIEKPEGVEFAEITATANFNEYGTVAGSGIYCHGTTATLTAIPNQGYIFVNWVKDSTEVSTEATYSFTVTENATYVANFRIPPYHFTTAGTWSTLSNWQGGALPGTDDEVFIDAPCQLNQNATVAVLTVSDGQSLTLQSGKTLTVTGDLTNTATTGLVIEDGAQLVHNVDNVQATVRKVISPFNGTSDSWHLIALPLTGSIDVDSVVNLLEGEYDLYSYDETTTYWKNKKTTESDFTELEATKGYLYANSAEVTLGFSGTLENSSDTVSVPLSYTNEATNEADLSGFNLVGNPFPCNAYLDREYYVLSTDGSGINTEPIPANTPIPPCTAVFVKAVAEGETVVFTRVVQ